MSFTVVTEQNFARLMVNSFYHLQRKLPHYNNKNWTELASWILSNGLYTQVLKNNVYNVSGMIEEVKTNMFFIWQNFGLCTVLALDGLKCRCLDFRHNTHRLVLFVLLCLQQVERAITVSTKTCYDK